MRRVEKAKPSKWKASDSSKLIRLWPKKDIGYIAAALQKSEAAVSSKARRMGLKLSDVTRKRWTSDELRKLSYLWPSATESKIAESLVGRTWNSIKSKADEIGISDARFRGHKSVSSAAKLLGVCRPTLIRIMSEAKVKVRRSGRISMVDMDSARQCLESWLESGRSTETIVEASARTGVERSTLRRWLTADGHHKKSVKGVKARLRVEVVDRVVESRKRA
jgi:predicted DNA-binding protein (UPF0251 family)